MKSWKITLPRRRCPNCGETVWFTFDGVARIHSPQRPGRGALRKPKTGTWEKEPTEDEGG
jgi:hypothetical protein